MIKNEQQLSVTKSQRVKLCKALEDLKSNTFPTAVDEIRMKSLEADLARLDKQIERYMEAVEGRIDLTQIVSVEHVGEELIYARIASGLTQEDLARRVGAKAQQIQRYERGQYMSASLKTLAKISTAILCSYEERRVQA
jgi:HTH-type transcriptional regulator/antitoxin HigA